MSVDPSRPAFAPLQERDGEPLLEPPLALRIGLLGLGGVLAIGGAWMLICALLLPQAIALPLDREAAAAAAPHRGRAVAAARLGVVRGDLYAQAAYADAGLLWPDAPHGPEAAAAAKVEDAIQYARSNAVSALALAPVNGSAWLFLAALPAPSSTKPAEALAALQMSYLTAPNDPALGRPRLERALAAAVPIDTDLQEFMKSDLRQILTRQPQQKAAIVAAYKAASPQNQTIFESLAATIDPDFSQSLRGETPK
jgi:hypothetical protein